MLGSGSAAGVMLSMRMSSTPLTAPRVPLTTYVPVSPLENLASASAAEASALSEASSSYRLPSTSNFGRLSVPEAAAAPVKVSLSAAYNPTAEPTSTTSAMETIDNLFMPPSLPLCLSSGFLLWSCPPELHLKAVRHRSSLAEHPAQQPGPRRRLHTARGRYAAPVCCSGWFGESYILRAILMPFSTSSRYALFPGPYPSAS